MVDATCLYGLIDFNKSKQQRFFFDFSVLGGINRQDFGMTRVRRPDHSSIKLLLSQQLSMLGTEFSQLLGLLRDLLVKQRYFLYFCYNLIWMNLDIAGCCCSLSRNSNMALMTISPIVALMRSTALHSMLLKWSNHSRVAWKVSSSY